MRIYYEIETLKRELDARIFFSIIAAARGHSVVIGKKNRLLTKIKYSSPGIYIFKANRTNPQRYSKQMRKLGYHIFSSDEEGHIIFNNESTLQRNPIDAFNVIDKYLAWGNEQANILKNEYKKKIENKIIICGNSRFDILKKPVNEIFLKSSEIIKKKYGEFDLYISAFHRYNALGNDKSWEKILNNRTFQNEKVQEAAYNIFHSQKNNMIKTINFLNSNSKKFKNKLIIRPHPSEDISTWKNELNKDLKDSVITDHENTNAWILAARNIFSYYSYSLVEAFMLGKIPYNLEFSEGKYFQNLNLYNCCEKIIKPIDYEDLMSKVENSKTSFSFKKRKENISDTIFNIDRFSSDIVCEAIEEMFANKKFIKRDDRFTNKLSFSFFKIIQKFKNFLDNKDSIDFKIYSQKNPGFGLQDIIKKVDHIGSLLNIKGLKCNELYPGVFEITKEKN
tara:strand:+ start:4448 stop:5797 length:1350 start_codon:yes stop_codon:yes gene_type:complete